MGTPSTVSSSVDHACACADIKRFEARRRSALVLISGYCIADEPLLCVTIYIVFPIEKVKISAKKVRGKGLKDEAEERRTKNRHLCIIIKHQASSSPTAKPHN